MFSTAQDDLRQRHLLWFGACCGIGFGVPLCLAPIATTTFFGMVVPPGGVDRLWLQLDGIFLVIVSLFALVTARDPSRYLGNVAVCLIGKLWTVGFFFSFVFARGAPQAFLFFATIDAVLLVLHFRALGSSRWLRLRTAFATADLTPGPLRLRFSSALGQPNKLNSSPIAPPSDSPQPRLDPQVALHFLQFVAVTYEQYRHFKNAATPAPSAPDGWRILWNVFGEEHDVLVPFGCAFLSNDETELVLAIRGTENHFEWIEDGVESDQIPWPKLVANGKVHRGFHDCYRSLRWSLDGQTAAGAVHQGFPTPLPQLRSFVISGHSLGAAVALIAAFEAAHTQWAPVPPSLFSFAGPRVGCPNFAEHVEQQIPRLHRIVNTWDLVPHTPPENYFDPFKLHEYKYQHPPGEFVVNPGFSINVAHNHALETYACGLRMLLGPIQ